MCHPNFLRPDSYSSAATLTPFAKENHNQGTKTVSRISTLSDFNCVCFNSDRSHLTKYQSGLFKQITIHLILLIPSTCLCINTPQFPFNLKVVLIPCNCIPFKSENGKYFLWSLSNVLTPFLGLRRYNSLLYV